MPSKSTTKHCDNLPVRLSLVSILLLTISGCSSFGLSEKKANELFERNGVDILSAAPDRKFILIKENKSQEAHCLSPSPDYANTSSNGISLSENMGPAGSASIGDTVTKGAATLGGRSPAVLLVRELLYRTCEFNMNSNNDPAESRAIYMETLRVIEKIVTSSNGATSGTDPLDAEPGMPAIAQPETSY